MQTVLLTGGSGFLGSKIVELLLAKGHRVIILLRKESSTERLEGILSNPKLIKVFSEENWIEKCFSENQIDTIMHTATCYGRNNELWPEIAEPNLILPLRLLSAGERNSTKCFINADTFFNEKINFEKNENHYVQTKKDFLEVSKNATKSLNIKFVNMRIEQMYGPEDNPQKFIPIIIKQLLSSAGKIPLTQGKQKRDLIFVDDVATAFISVLETYSTLENYEEFNVGTGVSIPIQTIVEYVKEITKSNAKLEFGALEYRKNEIMDSFAHISKNQKINWHSTINWKDGIKKTVEFYSKNFY